MLLGKQFLYVSLLMVFLGPLWDPFFRPQWTKINKLHALSRNHLKSGRASGHMVWVGRSDVSEPAR